MNTNKPRRAPKCHRCGRPLEQRIAPTHWEKMKYDDGTHEIVIEGMPQCRCEACDVAVTDDASDVVVQDCLRRHIGLLTAGEIRAGRVNLGLTQSDLGQLLGCAAESLSRWENGAVLQSRTYDRLLRLFFQLPAVRHLLEALPGNPSLGRQAVAGPTDPSPSVVEAMKAQSRMWHETPRLDQPVPFARPRTKALRSSRSTAEGRAYFVARKPGAVMPATWAPLQVTASTNHNPRGKS